MASMENRSQRSGSATVTFHAGSPSQSGTGSVPGSRHVAPRPVPISRAMPRIDRQ